MQRHLKRGHFSTLFVMSLQKCNYRPDLHDDTQNQVQKRGAATQKKKCESSVSVAQRMKTFKAD